MLQISYPTVEDKKLDRLLTVEEMRRLLNVKKSFIYTLTHQKRIPHYKIGKLLRFRESEINEWLAERSENGGA
jgi:excisionase family DNA binding protein